VPIAQVAQPALRAELDALEARHGGRLGVFVSTRRRARAWSAARITLSPDEHVQVSWLQASVLKLVDAGEQRLDRIVTYTEAEIEPGYSPVTKKNVATGMTVADLCAAAVVVSDNTAGNLAAVPGGLQGSPASAARLATR